MQQMALDLGLRSSARFDSFESASNGLAVNAIQRMISGRGESPIYIYGESATGKTHLLQAACHAMAETGERVAYLPLDLIASEGPAILSGWQHHRLIAIDALDALVGHAEMEQALFHLMNELRARDADLLLAARQGPKALGVGLPDLQSRLAWGLVIQLQPLTDEECLTVLVREAKNRGFDLPQPAAQYLLNHCRRDLHSLMKVLDGLDAASLEDKRRVSLPFVRDWLRR